jgi:hypothetical protein
MNKRVPVILLLILSLGFGVAGCGTNLDSESITIDEPETVYREINRVDDFEVELQITEKNEGRTITATITYSGEESEIDIYHGGSIFYFNIYEIDGDFEHMGSMDGPLLTTVLTRNEPHKVEMVDVALDELQSGSYEFEAVAIFSLDIEQIGDTLVEIPVSMKHSLTTVSD